MKAHAFLFTFIISFVSVSQPNTEVYLFDLVTKNGGYSLTNPINVSNNPGYDNQPSFWPDSQSLLYARTINGQTEIARYHIASGETEIITHTLQGSEYSPIPTPGGGISSIRLDTSGLQLLYQYDLHGNDEVLVKDLVIGYHTWINDHELVTFVLGDPVTMQLVDTRSSKSEELADRIGRSLHKIPGSKTFSFVDKSGDKWVIKAMNLKNRKITPLTQTLEGSEDYCWTRKKEIIMGQNNKLWRWNSSNGWMDFFDLSSYGLQGITRVAISAKGDKLALVINN